MPNPKLGRGCVTGWPASIGASSAASWVMLSCHRPSTFGGSNAALWRAITSPSTRKTCGGSAPIAVAKVKAALSQVASIRQSVRRGAIERLVSWWVMVSLRLRRRSVRRRRQSARSSPATTGGRMRRIKADIDDKIAPTAPLGLGLWRPADRIDRAAQFGLRQSVEMKDHRLTLGQRGAVGL